MTTKKVTKLPKDYATKYLGKEVGVIIDRPIGKIYAPKEKKDKVYYSFNYGYVPGTTAPDGEEIDAYILGVFEPMKAFRGKCIAVIHRTNDKDDKLIIAPNGKDFTDEEIETLVEFQERLFKHVIIRE